MASDDGQQARPRGEDPDEQAAKAAATTPADVAQQQAPPGATTEPHPEPEELTNRGVDRSDIIGAGVATSATWALRLLIIGVFTAALLWLVGHLWVGIFPAVMALIVSTVLWPPAAWLRRRGVPPALASALVMLSFFVLIGGIVAAIAPSVVDQAQQLSNTAVRGVGRVEQWLAGPPLNINHTQLAQLTDQLNSWLQGNGKKIAASVFAGLGTLGNSLVTALLVLVLTFFFIKDGPTFLPWLRRLVGRRAGRHLTEVLSRAWNTLSGYIRAQAMVSAVDGIFIGGGLLLIGVPLAIPLAILTFLGGFIPIVGAVTVGVLSILVALVSNGFVAALLVLGLVLLVQQLEGNVLSPFLQGRSMQLHGTVILLSVTAGGALFGVAGAFLAVPLAATIAVVVRYLGEQIDIRTGDLAVADAPAVTREGQVSAHLAGQAAKRWARRPPRREEAEASSGGSDAAEHRPGWRRLLSRD